ncbi:hypothetical protein [Streptomyces stelliscabiei]|uniref:hypothetical protein n=1 Tax=Streptomyces stelliscabiei TaxID=146820 RepID=UPI002FEEBDAA
MIKVRMWFQVVFVFPFFLLLGTREAVVVHRRRGVRGRGRHHAVQSAFFTDLFGTRVRCSGVSLGPESGTMVVDA